MSEPIPTGAHDLASMLKQARQAKGLELSDVAKLTNIRKDYLIALEEGVYADLPEPIYVRNFVRLFAQTVGLDSEKAVDQFRQERGDSKPAPPPSQPSSQFSVNQPRTFVNWLPAVALIIFLMVLSFWLVNRFFMNGARVTNTSVPSTTTPLATAESSGNAASSNESASLPSTDNAITNPANNATDTAPNAEPTENLSGSEAASNNSSSNTQETTNPESAGQNVTSETSPESVADESPSEATILLSIITNPPGAEVNLDGYVLPGTTPLIEVPVSASQDRTLVLTLNGYEPLEQELDLLQTGTLNFDLTPESAGATSEAVEAASTSSETGQLALSVEDVTWVEVYQSGARGEGERLVYTTLQPGDSYVFNLPVFVHVGNAGGVRVSLNGQDLGLLGSPGEVLSRAFGQGEETSAPQSTTDAEPSASPEETPADPSQE
ncbi:MAG: DUF4115 domain-containing protein [Trueperaceae bacterium]|nr:DUF4115 domain-containing protein [Trueperaceae bacterium]